MKWLLSTIIGILVVILAISFVRAQRADALALQTHHNAQALAVLAMQDGTNSNRGPVDTDKSATQADRPVVSSDARQSAPDSADKPAVRAGGALKPRNSDGRVVFEEVPAGDVLTPARSNREAENDSTGFPNPQTDSQSNGEPRVQIVYIRHHDAASLVELIKRMHPKGEKIYADPRNNVLIFPDGIEQRYLDILQELDQPAPRKRFDPSTQADNLPTRAASGRILGSDRQFVPADTTSSPDAQEYRRHESQAVEFANAYRQQLATSPQDAKRLDQLRAELQGAVHSAFHARQTWQRSQAAQLRARLEQIERRISERGQSANEIIQRRVEELLHPEKKWESDDESGNRSDTAVEKTRDRSAADSPSPKLASTDAPDQQNSAGERQIASKFAAQTGSDTISQSEPVRRLARGSLSDSAGDVRKDLLNAESAVATAQAAVTEAKAMYERSKLELRRAESLVEKGAGSERVVRAAQSEVERYTSAVNRAESELGIKQRMLASAREALALEIKLREADVADAKLQMDHATAELTRFADLLEQKAISREVYEAKKLPQELAASQYERAKLLLELYRKASIVDKPRAEQKPTSDWKTDFAAAQGLAQKQHRPLIAIFCRLADQTTHEFRAQVLEAPEVNRIVSERFKLVFVDLDAPENGEKLIQFGIDANPTILVLREDGSVLSRSDGSMSKKQFLDVLNKINPAGQTAGGTDDRAAVELTRRAVFDVTSDGSGDPRKRVLDAAHAVTSARAAVVEAEAHLAEYEQTLKRLQSVAPGTIPQKAIFEAEQALARSRAALLKMRVELEIKESQLEEARESLATQIKFQELDLADAKLRLQHADDEWSRAESLYKKGAMTASQLQEAQLAQRLAASQLERARMLLELYRKAIPGKEAPADKDQSNAELQFKDVWMTDFDAAQELAIKLHRPLVVFFWGRRGKPGQTLKADVLSNPAVLSNPLLANPDLLRVVAMHFVAVIVDVDIDKKTLALFEFGDVDKKVKQFNVDLVPSVVVLSWIGETRRVLARRDEEIGTAEILIDLLKKLIPEARIDAAAEGSAADNPRQSAEVKPDAPRASGRDPLSDDKPIEATQKAGDQSIGKQEE